MANKARRKRRGKQQPSSRPDTTAATAEVSLVKCLAKGDDSKVEVDREAGMIRNVAFISAGMAYPAVGEEFEIDETTLEQVEQGINSKPRGVKARITHPELENMFGLTDGILRLVGRGLNARVEDGVVRGDIQIGSYADASPSGKLGTYLMGIAEEDPEAIGISLRIGLYYEEREDQPPLGRVHYVSASDFVETPAANANGLLAGRNTPDTQPDGAGDDSHTSTEGALPMNETLRTYLTTLGLSADATEKEAIAFWNTRKGDEKKIADSLAGNPPPATEPTSGDDDPPAQPQAQNLSGGPQVDEAKLREEAAKAERERYRGLNELASRFKMGDEWVSEQMLAGTAVDDAKDAVLKKIEADNKPVATGHSISSVNDANLTSLAPAIEDAILARAGVTLYEFSDFDHKPLKDNEGNLKRREPHERAKGFATLSLFQIAQQYLKAMGVPAVDTIGQRQVLDLAMQPGALARFTGNPQYLAMSTGDFPYILGNTLRKSIRAYYAEAEVDTKWPAWCEKITNPDYKTMDLIPLSEAPELLARDEGGSIRYAALAENREQITLSEYARGILIERQAIVNDDKQAFTRIPRMMAQAARRKENTVTFAVLTANGDMADSNSLFDDTNHSNHVDSGGAPSVSNLDETAAKMRTQTGSQSAQDGDSGAAYLDIEPYAIIHPVCLDGTVKQLLSSTVDPAKSNSSFNPWANRLVSVSHAILDADDTTAWYLAGRPGGPGGGVVISFLEGEEAPVVYSEVDFDTDGVKYKVRHSVAAKANDWRGLVKNDGT